QTARPFHNKCKGSVAQRLYVRPVPYAYVMHSPDLLRVSGARLFPSPPEVPAQTSFPKRCTTNRPAIGGPFKLYDTEKNEVTESKLRGNWALMYFGYTSCPDVGPAEVQKMADVVKLLESKYGMKITPLFITIDPQRDSPSQLKAYFSEFESRIVGLTGPISAVRQIAQVKASDPKRVEKVGHDYLVESSHN
ncbi:hypothetical protein ACJX0J_031200, partial [Zea mays]